jgi:hypothetical protein
VSFNDTPSAIFWTVTIHLSKAHILWITQAAKWSFIFFQILLCFFNHRIM